MTQMTIPRKGHTSATGNLTTTRTGSGTADLAARPAQQVATLDRRADRAGVDRLLASARGGVGGSLVLRGEPGTGKTALLEYAAGRAAGIRLARVAGVESEMALGFAALHQLLIPFLARLDRIPEPQRDALRTAFGLVAAPAPDLFLVSLAALTLLADVAADQPLVVAVDDAQWLDEATLGVLGFVARRLRAQPIAFLVAVREPAGRCRPLHGLPELNLAGPSKPEVASEPAAAAVPRPRAARDLTPGRFGQAPSALFDAARELRQVAPGRARQALLDALYAALAAGRLGSGSTLLDIAGAVRTWEHPPQPSSRVVDLLLDGFTARLTAGSTAAAPALRDAVAALVADEQATDRTPGVLALGAWAAGEILNGEAQRTLAERWALVFRDQGAGDPPPIASSLPAGRGLGDLLVLAWRGQEAEVRSAAEDQVRDCVERGHGVGVTMAHYALAILELGLGRYEAALTCALNVYQDDPPDLGTHVLPDLVEAAARSGNRDAARSALERLAERATAAGTHLACGLLARSRALLADNGAAEGFYHEAIDQLGRSDSPIHLARARLLYGEWLRRRRRRRDAREQLDGAREIFDELGAEAFARRAWVELQATSERVGKRTGRTADLLTPQETQIAHLVAEGCSNRQIAAQLFISHNTVEYHLLKVFRKVGVSSRTQLARSLLDPARGSGATIPSDGPHDVSAAAC